MLIELCIECKKNNDSHCFKTTYVLQVILVKIFSDTYVRYLHLLVYGDLSGISFVIFTQQGII